MHTLTELFSPRIAPRRCASVPRPRRRAAGAVLAGLLAVSVSTAAEYGVSIHDLGTGLEELAEIRNTGFLWIRVDFAWADIEKSAGRYDFSVPDVFVERLRRSGLKAVVILDYGNPLYGAAAETTAGARRDTDEFRAAFANWAATVVARYQGYGFLWEIWNEPNIARFWPPTPNAAEYAALAMEAGTAIRARAPAEKMIGPAVSGLDESFLGKCFRAGLLEYWSCVSVHPYRSTPPETAAVSYASVRRLIDTYTPPGRTIPLVISEWGYPSYTPTISESLQAAYLTGIFQLSFEANVPLTIWYDWRDDGVENTANNRYGLVRSARDAAGRLVLKPSWYAARDFLAKTTQGPSLTEVTIPWTPPLDPVPPTPTPTTPTPSAGGGGGGGAPSMIFSGALLALWLVQQAFRRARTAP